jgi:hypothetical protein
MTLKRRHQSAVTACIHEMPAPPVLFDKAIMGNHSLLPMLMPIASVESERMREM